MNDWTWDYIQNIFLALGGLGLFLFGLKTMSDGLKNIAGSRLRAVIGYATANRFLGFLVGMLVTAVIQSSTATSVMAIGFINAGLMTFSQFIGIIIGANVGSTFTAFLISFNVDPIAPLFIFIGIILHLCFKKKAFKDIGIIVFGLGTLFFGLSTMGAPLKEFSQLSGFQSMLTAFQNPLLAILAGLVFTAIVQSSAAVIGIIIAMYFGGVDMSFEIAVFLVLGSNVGTCSTAILSSLGASRESKRAAAAHLVYNIATCSVFSVVIAFFPDILLWFQRTWHEEARQIAMFHTLYNVVSAFFMLFFTRQLAAIIYFILPELPQEGNAKRLVYLGTSSKEGQKDVLIQSRREICRMGSMALNNLRLALEAFCTRDIRKAADVLENEETVNYLNKKITAHLIHIKGSNFSSEEMKEIGTLQYIVSDIERIADHAENIAEYAIIVKGQNTHISTEGMDELNAISGAAIQAFTLALEILEKQDGALIPQVNEIEQQVDSMYKTYMENHIYRLNNNLCTPHGSVIFTSMVSDLERCSDHACNIATWFKGLDESPSV